MATTIEPKKAKYGTKILPCTCSQAFQDSKYGRGMRVHNLSPKDGAPICTGCGKKK